MKLNSRSHIDDALFIAALVVPLSIAYAQWAEFDTTVSAIRSAQNARQAPGRQEVPNAVANVNGDSETEPKPPASRSAAPG
jgi:hypothetical protein